MGELGRPKPADVDRYVGAAIRLRRSAIGMSGMDLAAAAGMHYQQLYRCEVGGIRIFVGQILVIAEILGCEPADFYPKAPPVAEHDDRCIALLRDTASLSREERHVVFDAARRLAAA